MRAASSRTRTSICASDHSNCSDDSGIASSVSVITAARVPDCARGASTGLVDQVRCVADPKQGDEARIDLWKLDLVAHDQIGAELHHVYRHNDEGEEKLLHLAQIDLVVVVDFVATEYVGPSPLLFVVGGHC